MSGSTSAQERWALLQLLGVVLIIVYMAVVFIVMLVKIPDSPQGLFVYTAVLLVPVSVVMMFAKWDAARRGGPRLLRCTSPSLGLGALLGLFVASAVLQSIALISPSYGMITLATHDHNEVLVPMYPSGDDGRWMLACHILMIVTFSCIELLQGRHIRERGLDEGASFTPWESVDAKARDKFLENLSGKTEAERELIRKVIDERRGPPTADAAAEG